MPVKIVNKKGYVRSDTGTYVGSYPKESKGESFQELQKKVAQNYIDKPVKPEYQKDYGKTYTEATAMQAAARILAAKRYRRTEGRS